MVSTAAESGGVEGGGFEVCISLSLFFFLFACVNRLCDLMGKK